MIFSKACVYGIRAALYLAIEENRKYVPIKEVSEKLDISFHFLTKILQKLTMNNLIYSFKGPKGGVKLARTSEKINIYDIVTAIDGKDIFEECLLGLPGCSLNKPCPLHSSWADLRTELKVDLTTSNLAVLAKNINDGDLRLYDVVVKMKK